MSAKSITLLNWFSLFLAAFLSLWEQAWPTDCKSCSLFFSKSKVKFSQVITWSNGFDALNARDGYIYILYKLVNSQTYMTANEHDDTAEIIFKKYKRLKSLHINTKCITQETTNSYCLKMTESSSHQCTFSMLNFNLEHRHKSKIQSLFFKWKIFDITVCVYDTCTCIGT